MPIADLLVIGGGIHGTCVARDAARRGLSVVLVEKDDLAQGTSQRSSKLVHGGLRYLETAQFGLVRESLEERSTWLRIAPHLVRPLPFLLPFVRGAGRSALWIGLGLRLYDGLARDSPLPRHQRLTRDEALAREPDLPREGLEGAALFWDAAMDDAAIVIACAMDAQRAGATIRTRTPMIALVPASEAAGAVWRATLGDGETLEARRVINATGAWMDALRELAGTRREAALRPTRGTHVVVPALTREHALLLFARRDGRVFFVLPSGGHSLVGTTDTDHPGAPDAVAPTTDDVRYLWDEIAARWPGRRAALPAETSRVFAGLRPLVRARRAHPWDNPREARLLDERGLISVAGGKFTTARRLAERVVDRVVAQLGSRARPCDTAQAVLPDPRGPAGEIDRAGDGLTRECVAFAVEHAFARGLGDVLWRRSALWRDREAARRAAPEVAGTLGELLGWGSARRERELAAVMAECQAEDRVVAAASAGGKGETP